MTIAQKSEASGLARCVDSWMQHAEHSHAQNPIPTGQGRAMLKRLPDLINCVTLELG